MTCGKHIYLEVRDGAGRWEAGATCAFCGAARPRHSHRIAWDVDAAGLVFIVFVLWLGFVLPWLAAGWRMR